MEELRFVLAVLVGGGITYGAVITEIKNIKSQLKQQSNHAERLSAIEAKIDIVLSYFKKA
jgi:hypothetical protein